MRASKIRAYCEKKSIHDWSQGDKGEPQDQGYARLRPRRPAPLGLSTKPELEKLAAGNGRMGSPAITAYRDGTNLGVDAATAPTAWQVARCGWRAAAAMLSEDEPASLRAQVRATGANDGAYT